MSNETSVNRQRGTTYVNYDCDAGVATSVADRDVFVSTGYWIVAKITEVHNTASSSGTIGVRKITDASAPGAAASSTVLELLTAALSTATTANTPQNGALVTTQSTRKLKPGDRLALDFGGTVTSLAGCLVQIELQPDTKYI